MMNTLQSDRGDILLMAEESKRAAQMLVAVAKVYAPAHVVELTANDRGIFGESDGARIQRRFMLRMPNHPENDFAVLGPFLSRLSDESLRIHFQNQIAANIKGSSR
jgi:hypothetical protein